MASEKYIGSEISKAIKVPCSEPTAGDILTAGDSSILAGKFRKLGGASVDPNTEWAGGHLIRNGDFGVFGDGTTRMPDGWAVTVGTYGAASDIYVEATTVRGGKYALKMRTSTATEITRSVFDPVVKDALYSLQLDMQQSSVALDHDVDMSIAWYDSALALLSTSTSRVKAGAINTWTRKVYTTRAPAAARWAKVKVAKRTGAYDVFLDRVSLQASEAALPGSVINFESYRNGATTTGTTIVPVDDTIPTGTEGVDAGLGYVYTPRVVGSTLSVRAAVQVASDTADRTIAGFLNKDAGSAVATIAQYAATANGLYQLALAHSEVVTALTAVTWRVRVGPNAAATVRVNGNTARLFGGTSNTWIEFTEYAP